MAILTRNPHEAANWLKQGGLVAIPTETVYGLAADAMNPHAIEKLYQAKGRPNNHPVIVHCATLSQVEMLVSNFSPEARLLAEAFWPGPLTLVLPKAAHVSPAITAGQATVAIRIPNHSLTLEMLNLFNNPIVAPSANRFGQLSPTCVEHIQAGLGGLIDGILDGGPCQIGVESTIIGFQNGQPVLLRPGMITPEEIQARCNITVLEKENLSAPIVPGSLSSHYAPRTPLSLVSDFDLAKVVRQYQRVAVLSYKELPSEIHPEKYIQLSDNADAYAQGLYAALHALDAFHCDHILVLEPPMGSAWQAIYDRLNRAASSVDLHQGALHV